MEKRDGEPYRASPIFSAIRALIIAAVAAVIAVSAPGCDDPTQPRVVDVPPDKVPPKRENQVPSPKQHGPKYGVSPQVVPGSP